MLKRTVYTYTAYNKLDYSAKTEKKTVCNHPKIKRLWYKH